MKKPLSKMAVWLVAGIACGLLQTSRAQVLVTNSPIKKTALSLDVGALWNPAKVAWAVCSNSSPPQVIYDTTDTLRGIAYNGPCAEYPFYCQGSNVNPNILFVASLKRDVRNTDWRGYHNGSWKLLCEGYLTNISYKTNITSTITNKLVCTNRLVCTNQLVCTNGIVCHDELTCTNRLECTNELICHDQVICTNQLVCTNWVDCVSGNIICTNRLECTNWVDCVPGEVICTNGLFCTNEVFCQTNWNGSNWVVDCFTNPIPFCWTNLYCYTNMICFTNTYCWTNLYCYTNMICNTNTYCWTNFYCYTNMICDTNTFCWTNFYCYTNTICDTNTFCWTNQICNTNWFCITNRVAIKFTNVVRTVSVTTNSTLLASGSMKGSSGAGTHRRPLLGRQLWWVSDECSDCAHFEGYMEGVIKYPPTPVGSVVSKIKATYTGNFVINPFGQNNIPIPWATNAPISCPSPNLPAGPVQMTIEGVVIEPCR